ncbi:hypothetical protein GOARA_082_00340 [Gordonia araii NBRC 100433]|uniref:Uncharacterized protein n=1 Tax=Gordonia araii NBRC 100433 TaxID=1073574 RepID=G7H722_9ACTN|nr:hypothetical protein GOARA_082_00340 [Gordonia araii NBRC 100433]
MVRRHQTKFCSNACQRELDRRRKTELWLAGDLTTQPDSRRRHFIRLHLLDAQSGRCAQCGITNHWNGSELIFVLDHVDGDSTNNRRENLRLVCPNCDSQLPTYKSRNRGNGRAWRRRRYADGKSY